MPFHRASSSRISSYSNKSKPRNNPTKAVPPRRVVPSKKLSLSSDGKSCSEISGKKTERSKPVTKSDLSFRPSKKTLDYCKHRGDSSSNDYLDKDDVETLISMQKLHPKTTKPIKQYYINENFKLSSDSIKENGYKKICLDTISEVPEIHSIESLFHFDSDGDDNINDIKEFRLKNYFECHSTDSRIKNRGSTTSLKDHKCVYRFYLNDRLFPVPLCTDHTKEIRCIECLLPMNLQAGSKDKINGTIQAKVTLGKKNQDVMILLPIREPLIIHEKRKEREQEEENLFFGLINLDKTGHSVFKPNYPGNSLALKYQKGFQEFKYNDEYNYHDIDRNDAIVI